MVTPEWSNVGVNVNLDKFYEAYDKGTSFDDVVDKAVDVINGGLDNTPSFDVATLSDYQPLRTHTQFFIRCFSTLWTMIS